MTETRISVVIPTYRRRECVRRLLEALTHQTIPPALFNVVVAIDGSGDGTREMVEAFQAPYKISSVWQQNAGRASACNLGARRADGDVLLFLDDDMEPEPGCVAAHLRAHVPGSNLAVLGHVPVIRSRADDAVQAYIQSKFECFLEKLSQPGYRIGVRDFFTGNTSVRHDSFEAVGGFDEDFKRYGLEDTELGVRLCGAGVRFLYSVEAIARQHYLKSFGDLAHDTMAKGFNEFMLARKHPEIIHALRIGNQGLCSWKRRTLRSALLATTTALPALPEIIIHSLNRFARLRASGLDRWYECALDYFFWLGVQQATRKDAQELTPGVHSQDRLGAGI